MSGFQRPRNEDPQVVVRRLREHALTVSATDLNVTPSEARPHVWGVLMETGYAEGVATLVVFAEGTTSLYFSNGGGIIGAGEHASVRSASEALLSAAEQHLADCSPTEQTPLPPVGGVRFYLRTFGGLTTAHAAEADLGEGRHALSPLFYAGHQVITAVRESSPPA